MRIYFNKQGDRPWSVDDGPMTPEDTYPSIELHGVSGKFVYEEKAGDNINMPTAWFQVTDEKVSERSYANVLKVYGS